MSNYQPNSLEPKWQEKWQQEKTYQTQEHDFSKPKCYILDMFPYPSGTGLHVGHPKGYIATDVVSRLKMLQGYNVLHPMGWDAFGLPAENYAIKNKVHPEIATNQNIATYKKQLEILGFTYDWSREINTTDPAYYKWTQWIFLKMFEQGLAYESFEPINWCPSCKTGLANEDLEGDLCERCGSKVEKKPLRQWVLKITDYADRLLADLENLPEWEDSIKEMQRNWIGRSEGTEVTFKIADGEGQIKVFTTRVDTIFGCTYLVLAPENLLVQELHQAGKIQNWNQVFDYLEEVKNKSDLERTDLNKDKTGVPLKGVKAINPFSGEAVEVFVADYVLNSYGTGAVMAVPAHDQRDFDFARKHNLAIRKVIARERLIAEADFEKELHQLSQAGKTLVELIIAGKALPISPDEATEMPEERAKWLTTLGELELLNGENASAQAKLAYGVWEKYLQTSAGWKWQNEHINLMKMAFCDDGVLVDSGEFTGLTSAEARVTMAEWLEKHSSGARRVNYKLKDWVFSRQRYWGEPIPVIHCPDCGPVGVPEKDLPVTLPEVEHYEPSGTGESPLANMTDWLTVPCPKCGQTGRRETNTMPQWAGSSWYYLRYIDAHNTTALVDPKKEKYWQPVDLYVGGAEHATRHLIYARFWHKFLFDLGVVSTPEPFTKLRHVGLIMGEDGRKMSKRWGNVVNPDHVVAEYGADAMRLYEMFMGPFDQAVNWSTKGLIGTRRFLDRVWNNCQKAASDNGETVAADLKIARRQLYKTLQKVATDIVEFKFNTAVSQLMIFANEVGDLNLGKEAKGIWTQFLFALAPFAPHLAEELWQHFGGQFSIFHQQYPEILTEYLIEDELRLAVQVNGKVRAEITVAATAAPEDILQQAKIAVEKHLTGLTIIKEIYIPGKLVSLVVK